MNKHIFCLKQACDQLNIPYTEIGKSTVFLKLDLALPNSYFIANEVPFNDHITNRIVEDKSFTSELLSDVVAIPPNTSYIDPDCADIYKDYLEHQTRDAIVEAILRDFALPVILKKNSGSQGKNVFRCQNKEEITQAVATIFDQTSRDYDHVLVAQQNIEIAHEYRVTVFQQEVMLVYEKDFSQATFTGNLSPFHWEGARATVITDDIMLKRMAEFVQPIYQKLALNYGGLDIAIDTNDQMWMFEINAKPAYNYLVKDNGDEVLIDLYKRILRTF